MKTGYSDINISRYYKTSLSPSAAIEKIFLEIISKNSVEPELVDTSTIYFENSIWDMRDRLDSFHGAVFGKIIVLPHENGVHIKYQISVLPYRILAIGFLLFGCMAPIYILFSVTSPNILVCLQIPVSGLGFAIFSYLAGIAILVTRLDNLILKAIKD